MSPERTSAEVYDQLAALLVPATPAGTRRSTSDVADGLKKIRRVVLTEGIPEVQGRPSLRPRIWKFMLKVDHLESEAYLRYVAMGASGASAKIKDDTFRTLKTDQSFKGRVTDEMLVRLLDTFEWKQQLQSEHPLTYVQGMNALAAPFLYTMPTQVEAFACFSLLIERWVPEYVQTDLRGVHRGVELLNRCLHQVDPELYKHLMDRGLEANLYAFASVLTLCTCTPPLDEVLKLWDFLLAFGVHLNVLCVIAQLLLIREELMNSASPMKVLRQFPQLQARKVIGVTVALIKDIPEDLYTELVAHTATPEMRR